MTLRDVQWREELTRRFPKLTKLGPGCYVVGGAARDLLLGREPADVDVACIDALAAAKKIRDRVIRLGGEEHLSAYRVVDGDAMYDVAELLERDLSIDLTRRDFTMNAMAVDLATNELLDPHGGQRDIAARLVRMVRASNFDDDPLRILKGVRMAIRYGFEIEASTLEAIRTRAPRILDVAPERVTYELSVIFSSSQLRRALAMLQETNLAGALGLSLRDAPGDDVSLAGAYALLVDDPRAYGERWRWSETLTREVLTLQRLVQQHDRLALYDAGETIARQLPPLVPGEQLDWPDFAIKPLLKGEELAQLTGISPGKELGTAIRKLLEAQVRGEVKTREEAVAFVVGAPPPPSS
jgi:tRNA nucleotidyltransferase/poly(A) polymerase